MKQGKQISAVLFGVLAVFQMFIVRYMMNNAALTGVPIMVLAEIAAAPVFAAACVWLFSRDGVLSPVGKKVLAGSALFYLLFIAVYYDLEVNLILSGLSTLGQELANGLTPGYLGMAAKVVLLVLAVGFAVTAPKKPGEPSELKEVLLEQAMNIVVAFQQILEKTPPELAADIGDRGIVLTGGGALLRGMDTLIERKTGVSTLTVQNAMSVVAVGTGKYAEVRARMEE